MVQYGIIHIVHGHNVPLDVQPYTPISSLLSSKVWYLKTCWRAKHSFKGLSMSFCRPRPTGSQRNTGDKLMQVFGATCRDHKHLLFKGHIKRIYYTFPSINNLTTIEADSHSKYTQSGRFQGGKYTVLKLSLHLSGLCKTINWYQLWLVPLHSDVLLFQCLAQSIWTNKQMRQRSHRACSGSIYRYVHVHVRLYSVPHTMETRNMYGHILLHILQCDTTCTWRPHYIYGWMTSWILHAWNAWWHVSLLVIGKQMQW